MEETLARKGDAPRSSTQLAILENVRGIEGMRVLWKRQSSRLSQRKDVHPSPTTQVRFKLAIIKIGHAFL